MLADTDVQIPDSADDAIEAFGDGEGVTIVAGGTIVMPDLTAGRIRPKRALLLGRAGLGGIRRSGGKVTIGAGTSVAALVDGDPPLAQAARHVADIEVRAQATVGGNLCAASFDDAPRGDLQAALLALGATVRSAGKGGETTEPLEEFLSNGAGRLVLDVSYDDGPRQAGYAAVWRPHSHHYTILAVSAVRRDGDLRIAATGVAPRAVLLDGDDPLAGLELRDDALASAWYRTQILPRVVERALADLEGTPMNLTVNGVAHDVETHALRPLLSVLRDELGITGPKAGCQQGGCGTCTVLVDGEPRRSCLLPVAAVDGAAITTVEGLGTPDNLAPVQAAFHEHYGSQCGFCTPGMLLATHALIERSPGAGRAEIEEALAGHVCRCTGYVKILEAVEAALRGDVATVSVMPEPDPSQPEVDVPGEPRMKAVGARLPRYDGVAHVTGRTEFVDDVRVANMLWAKALRSPVHHAAITRLDTTKAAAMKGVRAIITWEDVPRLVYGHLEALGIPGDEPLLARDEVRYKGQPIALVAAEDEETAQLATEAIEVDFDERPALFDIRNAADPDAPQIHQWGNWYPHFEAGMDVRQIRKGDIDRAFDEADTIVSGVYRPAAIEQVPMETQIALAVPEASGRLTIYSCTQALYFSMGVVAAHLEVPLNRLKFVGGTVGGGFGGKVDTAAETVSALAALKSGRPVKWRWTREEEFLCSSTRAPWHMEIADAVSKDGWILGRKMLTLHDSGAYARFSPYGVTKHSFHHTGAYTIPNLHFDGYVVFTNRVPTTAMRGFGVTSVSFATEVHVSRIADVLGIDPFELRLKNANRIGDTSPNGIAYSDPSTVPTIHAIADAIGHELPGDYRTMTRDPREGDLLPEHLVSQIGEVDH